MDSEEKTESQPDTPKEDSGAGSESKNLSILEQVRAEREKSEKVLAEFRAENDRREKLYAEERLGGVTKAQPPVKQEESPKEYADRVMKGEL